ncbi:MAG TPA: hypothetical protein VHB54_02450 [Mucilaginibacter sp.]|nr:hypothetical protein [Mucilaginibacter sp.]
MKRIFTKLASAVLFSALISTALSSGAQSTAFASAATLNKTADKTDLSTGGAVEAKAAHHDDPPDSTWKPQRRLWGYAFGDEYYDAHADKGNRGAENNYVNVPTYRNAFQFRRLYLGYDYDITKRFKAEVLLASEPTANTGVNGSTSIQNGDNLVDNHMGFFIKNFNLRYRDIWNGTDIVVGELSTPGFALNEPGTNAPTSLSETTWGYRSVERTITDFHKNNSFDVGAALQGTFDPKTKNFGYVIMVSNNSASGLLSAANPNTGFYKIFYNDIWGKFFNQHLYVDIYYHYARTAQATALVGGQSNNMEKIFVAYVSKPIRIGVEAYTQTFVNGVTNKATGTPQNATVHGITYWVTGPIVKNKLGFFAKTDRYNPFTDYDPTVATYTVNTNYGAYNPYYKERFYTAGLDWTPAKNIHFMPNIWLIDYNDPRASTTTGYVAPDHTLVYRATFFFTFGK